MDQNDGSQEEEEFPACATVYIKMTYICAKFKLHVIHGSPAQCPSWLHLIKLINICLPELYLYIKRFYQNLSFRFTSGEIQYMGNRKWLKLQELFIWRRVYKIKLIVNSSVILYENIFNWRLYATFLQQLI